MPRKNALAGLNILITREQSQAALLSQLLQENGAQGIVCPLITFSPPSDWRPVDQALSNLSQYSGLFFTSVNGVKFFFERIKKNIKGRRLIQEIPCYAIGPATAKALAMQGIQVRALPEQFQAEGLIDILKNEEIKGQHFLFPRALKAREILPEFLIKNGAQVDIIVVYQTKKAEENKIKLQAILSEKKIDYLTFTSSSTVHAFDEMTDDEAFKISRQGIPAACIGEITAKAARSLEFCRILTAPRSTIPALVQTIIDDYKSQTDKNM